MKSRTSKETRVEIGGDSLRATAQAAQGRLLPEVMQRVMEQLHAAALKGAMGCEIEVPVHLEGFSPDEEEFTTLIIRELGEAGIAAVRGVKKWQGTPDIPVIKVSWKEGVA